MDAFRGPLRSWVRQAIDAAACHADDDAPSRGQSQSDRELFSMHSDSDSCCAEDVRDTTIFTIIANPDRAEDLVRAFPSLGTAVIAARRTIADRRVSKRCLLLLRENLKGWVSELFMTCTANCASVHVDPNMGFEVVFKAFRHTKRTGFD